MLVKHFCVGRYIFICSVLILLFIFFLGHGKHKVLKYSQGGIIDHPNDVNTTTIHPFNLPNYQKDIQGVLKTIQIHRKNYGPIHSYNGKYEWQYMDIKKMNLTSGELLVVSSMQKVENNSKLAKIKQNTNDVNKKKINQFDEALIKHIRYNWVRNPSKLPYNFLRPNKKHHSLGQSIMVDYLLSNLTGGFFVECGALDGETVSNTLFFERFRSWTGLLIEADPINYQQALQRNRKAYLIPACLAIKEHAEQTNFNPHRDTGKINSGGNPVQCFPLFSILKAMNQTRVDYLSLDVEGAELKILKTIPFNDVDIRIITAEFVNTPEGKFATKEFMISKGYNPIYEVDRDVVFVKTKF